MARRGPVYDDAVKALCALQPAVLCRWLGVPVHAGTRTVPHSESLPAGTRQVDALIAADGQTAVHIEFQSFVQAFFAFRMLEYLLRLLRLPRLAGMRIEQHVVMLGEGRLDEGLHLDGLLDYAYPVHYVRDQPVGPLLAEPVLAPFATLADVPDDQRPVVFRRALDLIAAVTDDHQRDLLAGAAYDLAAIRLPPATIDDVWKESAMPVPSLRQRIYDEAHEQGLERGLEQAAASMLRVRFGDDGRIDEIAGRLACLGPTECMRRIDAAGTLDDLA